MKTAWASPLSDRYHLQLSDSMRDWLDRAWYRYHLLGEFDQAVDPGQLMESAPAILWPGFMLPDTLPLVGNRYGDWLCIQVDASNEVVEIIHWYHGGGDYQPIGKSIAEAIFYDRCRALAPGYRSWAGEPITEDGTEDSIEWLAEQLGQSIDRLDEILECFAGGDWECGLDAFDEHGWSSSAIARDRTELALHHRFRQYADPKLAVRFGVSWEHDITKWSFDLGQIPVEFRGPLRDYFDVPEGSNLFQKWDIAEPIALRVLEQRQDLAWASDIAGWCALRRGDMPAAIDRWWRGLKSSVFTDQSTLFKTHWFDRRFGKFSAAQLYPIQYAMDAERRSDPYWNALTAVEHGQPHQRVTAHWIGQASRSDNTASQRYDAWYRAGWDVGCQQIALFEPILENLMTNAAQSNQLARARIAEAYLAKLRLRS